MTGMSITVYSRTFRTAFHVVSRFTDPDRMPYVRVHAAGKKVRLEATNTYELIRVELALPTDHDEEVELFLPTVELPPSTQVDLDSEGLTAVSDGQRVTIHAEQGNWPKDFDKLVEQNISEVKPPEGDLMMDPMRVLRPVRAMVDLDMGKVQVAQVGEYQPVVLKSSNSEMDALILAMPVRAAQP